MRVSICLSVCLLVWPSLATPVRAADRGEPIGYVKTVMGSAHIVRSGVEEPVSMGCELYTGDRIRTGERSSVGFTLRDGTRLTAGAKTEILLDQYAFEPLAGEFGFVARVWQGTIELVSGLLAKMAPGSTSIVTPTGVIKPEGTRLVVKVDEPRRWQCGPSSRSRRSRG